MMTNELLLEKEQTQKKLDKRANHNLVKYVENTHLKVKEFSTKLGLKLKYGVPSTELQNNNETSLNHHLSPTRF